MPDTNVTAGLGHKSTRDARPAWRRLLAEPLVHFLALGGVLFILSAVLAPAEDQARIIEVTPEIRRDIAEQFRVTRGRLPSDAEFGPLIENWIRTQILYREAQALGLDKGDEMIRERITHKMNLLVFSNLRVPQPTDDQLRTFFAANRARYDQPTRYDFLGLLIEGEGGREQAEAYVRALDVEDAEPPAELMARMRAFANRDRAGIAAPFGAAFADALAAMEPDTWRALPIEQSGKPGWLVTRLARVREGRVASFELVRPELVEPWKVETGREMANKVVAEMGARYTIRRDPAR